jgi:large subunit ribosomal protein L14
MVIIGTNLTVLDNSGFKIAKCISVINKGNIKIASIGNIILVTLVRYITKKKIKKRTIYIGLIIGIRFWVYRYNGFYIKLFSNNILIYNKQFKFLGSRIYGLLLKEVQIKNIKIKQYRTYFNKIITYKSFII